MNLKIIRRAWIGKKVGCYKYLNYYGYMKKYKSRLVESMIIHFKLFCKLTINSVEWVFRRGSKWFQNHFLKILTISFKTLDFLKIGYLSCYNFICIVFKFAYMFLIDSFFHIHIFISNLFTLFKVKQISMIVQKFDNKMLSALYQRIVQVWIYLYQISYESFFLNV